MTARIRNLLFSSFIISVQYFNRQPHHIHHTRHPFIPYQAYEDVQLCNALIRYNFADPCVWPSQRDSLLWLSGIAVGSESVAGLGNLACWHDCSLIDDLPDLFTSGRPIIR